MVCHTKGVWLTLFRTLYGYMATSLGWTRWLYNLAGLRLCIRASRTRLMHPCIKLVTSSIVTMAIFAFVKLMACNLCIANQNHKYLSLWLCGLVAYASSCYKSCTIPVKQLTLVSEKLCMLCLCMFGGPVWLSMLNTLLLAVKCDNVPKTSTSILQVCCNHCLFRMAKSIVVLNASWLICLKLMGSMRLR